jgi:hypothetical protein
VAEAFREIHRFIYTSIKLSLGREVRGKKEKITLIWVLGLQPLQIQKRA